VAAGSGPARRRELAEELAIDPSWPVGHDTILLSMILHDWSGTAAARSSRSAGRRCQPVGR
jgi:hypothetical protein